MAATIAREIRFYRVDTGLDSTGKPNSFDPTPTFQHIEKLKWKDTGNGSRYWDDNGKITGCWVHSTDKRCKISLGSIRRSDFPLVENQGELSPLEIPEKAGLAEQTYIVFLEDNIVGCDINFFGPRISRLSYYLSEKALGHSPEFIQFNPILRRDVYQQLKEFSSLKWLKLKVRASYAETIANIDDSLGSALKACRNAGAENENDIDIELILQASSKRSSSFLKPKLLETVKYLGKNPDIQYEIEKLIVYGYNAKKLENHELNLLSDKLIIKREVAKKSYRSRALNETSAFNAIISAYEEVKDEIKSLPSVEL